jgi:hypothetical protein
MALLHAPAFLGTWGAVLAGEGSIGLLAQCIGLTASMLFFVLKFCDISYLRWRTNWRSCLALGLVIAIVHLGVLESETPIAMWLECSPVVSLTLLPGPSALTGKSLSDVWARLQFATRSGLSIGRLREALWVHVAYVHRQVLSSRTCIPRSPPA